jgi:hypothetical protein
MMAKRLFSVIGRAPHFGGPIAGFDGANAPLASADGHLRARPEPRRITT